MKSYFGANFFKGNRERLRKLVKSGAPIVLTANGLIQKSADETYAFWQDSNFWYLTGIEEPNVVLVMDETSEYLIVPELSHAKEMFDGAIDKNLLKKVSGINKILAATQGWESLTKSLKLVNKVGLLAPSPAFVDVLGMYTNPARGHLASRLKEIEVNLEMLDVRPYLQEMRMAKQQSEIQAIKKAVYITSQGFKKAETKFRAGEYGNEFEISLDLTRSFREEGGGGHAYDPIIAGTGRAAQIHYMNNDQPIDSKQPVLLDVGANFSHYAADITRCWALSPGKRYLQVYRAVAEVHEFALNLLRPGVGLSEYEKEVEQFMGEKLRELGLVKSNDPEAIRRYYPHRTSHFLGIDVHDFGDYDKQLPVGCVLTVEPGIYIPEEGIGIRLEDDILITKDGYQNLSADLPLRLS